MTIQPEEDPEVCGIRVGDDVDNQDSPAEFPLSNAGPASARARRQKIWEKQLPKGLKYKDKVRQNGSLEKFSETPISGNEFLTRTGEMELYGN